MINEAVLKTWWLSNNYNLSHLPVESADVNMVKMTKIYSKSVLR